MENNKYMDLAKYRIETAIEINKKTPDKPKLPGVEYVISLSQKKQFVFSG